MKLNKKILIIGFVLISKIVVDAKEFGNINNALFSVQSTKNIKKDETVTYFGIKLNSGSVNFRISGDNYYDYPPYNSSGYYEEFTPIFGLGLGVGIKYNVSKLFIGCESYLNYTFDETETKIESWSTYKEMEAYKLNYGLSAEINALIGYNLIKEFDIYVLFGGIYSKPKMKYKDSYDINDIIIVYINYKNNIAFQYGIGLIYNLENNISFKLQNTISYPKYRYTYKNKDYEENNITVITISLGLNYTF